MGQRKHKPKKRKSRAPAASKKAVYNYSLKVSVITATAIAVFWVIALLATRADPGVILVLVGFGLTMAGVVFCMTFALGRFELDDNGVTIIRPFRRKRFKWSELDELEHAEGYHAPTDHYVPRRTNVAYVAGATAFTATNRISRYTKLRDDLRDRLHRAARSRHRH